MAENKLTILSPDDKEWDVIFNSLPLEQQDIYYTSSFCRLCQSTIYSKHQVLCAAMYIDGQSFMYPFVKRSVGLISGLKEYSDVYDTNGIYGRNGIVCTDNNRLKIDFFNKEFQKYANNNNIICSFDRFHPIIRNENLMHVSAQVVKNDEFVFVDLSRSESEIRKLFKHSVRKCIKKSEREGVTCFSEKNFDHIDAFLDIYIRTMDRNSAENFYYFSKDFFTKLCEYCPDNFTFFYASVSGEIVSCELVLHYGIYSHSFLGGTTSKGMQLCANSQLKSYIIFHMKHLNCEYFLLGGGSTPNDGIFNYKKSFSKDGVIPSFIGGVFWDICILKKLKFDLIESGLPILENRIQFYDLTK